MQAYPALYYASIFHQPSLTPELSRPAARRQLSTTIPENFAAVKQGRLERVVRHMEHTDGARQRALPCNGAGDSPRYGRRYLGTTRASASRPGVAGTGTRQPETGNAMVPVSAWRKDG